MKPFVGGTGISASYWNWLGGIESFWSPWIRLCLPGSPTVLVAQLAPCVDAGSILAADSKSRLERAAASIAYPQS